MKKMQSQTQTQEQRDNVKLMNITGDMVECEVVKIKRVDDEKALCMVRYA